MTTFYQRLSLIDATKMENMTFQSDFNPQIQANVPFDIVPDVSLTLMTHFPKLHMTYNY